MLRRSAEREQSPYTKHHRQPQREEPAHDDAGSGVRAYAVVPEGEGFDMEGLG